MQNGRGDLEIGFRRRLVAQHSVSYERQINFPQPFCCGCEHLRVGSRVIEIRNPSIYLERAACQQILSHGGQTVPMAADQHETRILRC